MDFSSYLLESLEDKGLFKVVFMSGQQGSGKSTSYKKIIKGGDISPRVVTIDKWIEFIDPKKHNELRGKAQHLTMAQLVLYVNGCLPLFVETTGGDLPLLKQRTSAIQKIGYDVAGIFVNTSLETSLKRVKARGETKGGRNIELDVVEKTYHTIESQKGEMKSLFSTFLEIDNNDGDLTNDIVLYAYKKILSFYKSPVNNMIGINNMIKMKELGVKYLAPDIMSMSEIKSILSRWDG